MDPAHCQLGLALGLALTSKHGGNDTVPISDLNFKKKPDSFHFCIVGNHELPCKKSVYPTGDTIRRGPTTIWSEAKNPAIPES